MTNCIPFDGAGLFGLIVVSFIIGIFVVGLIECLKWLMHETLLVIDACIAAFDRAAKRRDEYTSANIKTMEKDRADP